METNLFGALIYIELLQLRCYFKDFLYFVSILETTHKGSTLSIAIL